MYKPKFAVLLILLVFLLAACGPSQEELALQTQAAVSVTAVSWSRTPTLTLTSTATATPSPSGTPTRTATVTPTPTSTATITQTPSPTPLAGGGKIAFWGYPGMLYLLDPLSLERKVIFDLDDLKPYQANFFIDYAPAWSPDGSYLLFTLTLFDLPESRLYGYDVVNDAVTLLFAEEDFFLPIVPYWSEDGRYIFFGGRFNFGDPPDIRDVYYDADGKINLIDVEDGFALSTVDYPYADSRILGHMQDETIYIETSAKDRIILLDRNGEVLDEVPFSEEMAEGWGQRALDAHVFVGQGVMFNTCSKEMVWEQGCGIYRYSFESGSLDLLVQSEGTNIYAFAVSPDGKQVAYRADTMGVIDVETGETGLALDPSEGVGDLAWSPDGRYVVYVSRVIVNYYLQSSTLRWVGLEGQESQEIVGDIKIVELPAWGR